MATTPAAPTAATSVAASIVATILSSSGAVTNLTPGSVMRGIIDGVAQEIAAINQASIDRYQAAVISAPANLYQVPYLAAVGSTYLLTWTLAATATGSYTLASGSLAGISGTALQWQTSAAATLAPGQSVVLAAQCTTSGTVTNVPANTITQVVSPVSGLSVTNPSAKPTLAGRNAETAIELQARLQNRVAGVQRATAKALEDGAQLTTLTDSGGNVIEEVIKAKAYDYTPTAEYPVNVWIYVYNGSGPASTTLLSTAQSIIDDGYTDAHGTAEPGFKAAGQFVTVIDAPEYQVNVTASLLLQAGYGWAAVESAATVAIQQRIDGLDLGGTLSTSQLIDAILAVPGVADVALSIPGGNLTASLTVAAPTASPTLSAVTPTTATTLASGTYYVATAFANPWGTTPASPQGSVTLASGQAIDVAAISLTTGATEVVYYLSESVGSTTVLQDAIGDGSAATLTALPSASANAPVTSNTATLQGAAWIPGTISLTQQAS